MAKIKGQSRTNALALFGARGKMETPEQRENAALVLRLSDDTRMHSLSNMVLNKQFKQWSFTSCMEFLGLSLKDVSEAYKDCQKHHGFMKAADKLPEIMDQTADRAMDQICATCDSTGLLEGKQCPRCQGRGRIPADAKAVDQILESFDIIGKGRGLALNFDMRKISKSEDLSDLAESIGPLLNGETV